MYFFWGGTYSFSSSWQRAKPRTLQRLIPVFCDVFDGVSGIVCPLGVPRIGRLILLSIVFLTNFARLKDSVPDGSLKRSNFVWCDFHGGSGMVPFWGIPC